MRRVLIIILAILFLFPVRAAGKSELMKSEPEKLSAASAVLIEPVSGRILYAHNSRERRAIASTTKIMTALVAAEMCDPGEVLSIQSDCVKIDGASLYLEEDEQLSMIDMLYGLLLRSGNDAAAAIGKYVAGDIAHFVSMMNQKAWALGMEDTNFTNPHGLDADEHYSTAYDMAVLGAAFMRTPLLRRICTAEEYVSRELTTGRVRLFINNNKLLARDPRAIGIKIGWTEQAGRCLVASGRVGEMELIAVVLNAPDLYTDASKLFDYGFSQLTMQKLICRGQALAVVPIVKGKASRVALVAAESICYPVFSGETISYSVQMIIPDHIQAPVKSGQPLGQALVLVDGECQLRVGLVAASSVESKGGVWSRMLHWVKGRRKGD